MQNTKKLFLIMSARYFFFKWTIHKRRFILFSKEANGTLLAIRLYALYFSTMVPPWSKAPYVPAKESLDVPGMGPVSI